MEIRLRGCIVFLSGREKEGAGREGGSQGAFGSSRSQRCNDGLGSAGVCQGITVCLSKRTLLSKASVSIPTETIFSHCQYENRRGSMCSKKIITLNGCACGVKIHQPTGRQTMHYVPLCGGIQAIASTVTCVGIIASECAVKDGDLMKAESYLSSFSFLFPLCAFTTTESFNV